MIYVDFSYLTISCYFAQERECGEVNESDYRKHIIHTLTAISKKHGNKYGKILLCCEASRSWRYDIYPHYKALRKVARADDAVKWEEINKLKGTIQKELEEHKVFKVVHAFRAEGDDIIAILSEYIRETSLIVSEDRDFHQLHKFDHISQYSHRKGIVYRDPSPEANLVDKVLSGDRGDSIPNILSADDCFVLKIRQNTLSAKKKQLFSENFYIGEGGIPADLQKNFERNHRLISFEYIPEYVKTNIIESFSKPSQEVMFGESSRTLYLIQSGINPSSL